MISTEMGATDLASLVTPALAESPQPEAGTPTPAEAEDKLIILNHDEPDAIRAFSIFVDPHDTVRASAPMLNWIYLKRNGSSGSKSVTLAVRHYATV